MGTGKEPVNHTRLQRLQPQAMRAGQSTRMGPGTTRCAIRDGSCRDRGLGVAGTRNFSAGRRVASEITARRDRRSWRGGSSGALTPLAAANKGPSHTPPHWSDKSDRSDGTRCRRITARPDTVGALTAAEETWAYSPVHVDRRTGLWYSLVCCVLCPRAHGLYRPRCGC
jgi:hypothetical protein